MNRRRELQLSLEQLPFDFIERDHHIPSGKANLNKESDNEGSGRT